MFIKKLDYLSPSITFYYQGAQSHTSIISGIISIISISFVFTLAFSPNTRNAISIESPICSSLENLASLLITPSFIISSASLIFYLHFFVMLKALLILPENFCFPTFLSFRFLPHR